ncbi:hypothetical protein RRG08_033725 [Elysia crispata]|uniref:Uncharacterized protein n=1 Tax=Elysia crispata TaxID=231223 RepID=A0AAE1A9H9_9GAST|nr:hypothetical protein RRG08_033725 [Elysia crispata]
MEPVHSETVKKDDDFIHRTDVGDPTWHDLARSAAIHETSQRNASELRQKPNGQANRQSRVVWHTAIIPYETPTIKLGCVWHARATQTPCCKPGAILKVPEHFRTSLHRSGTQRQASRVYLELSDKRKFFRICRNWRGARSAGRQAMQSPPSNSSCFQCQ